MGARVQLTGKAHEEGLILKNRDLDFAGVDALFNQHLEIIAKRIFKRRAESIPCLHFVYANARAHVAWLHEHGELEPLTVITFARDKGRS